MSLTIITLTDRKRIVDALELPIEMLEEYGELYSALIELEDRQQRLGIDLVSEMRRILDSIESTQSDINDIRDGTSTTGIQGGASTSFNVIGEYSEDSAGIQQATLIDGEVVSPQSSYANLLTLLKKYKKDLHRILNLYRRKPQSFYNYYQRGNIIPLG